MDSSIMLFIPNFVFEVIGGYSMLHVVIKNEVTA